MKRLYFLVPNRSVAKAIVDDLLLARLEERHIHVLAKRGTPMDNLPEASVMQKTDFVPATQRGVAIGAAAGALGGVAVLALPLATSHIAGGIVLAGMLVGAGLGAWFGGMAGMSAGNSRLQKFAPAIEKGEFLMMVDVPMGRVAEFEQLVKSHHPEVDARGVEPIIPAFP